MIRLNKNLIKLKVFEDVVLIKERNHNIEKDKYIEISEQNMNKLSIVDNTLICNFFMTLFFFILSNIKSYCKNEFFIYSGQSYYNILIFNLSNLI